MAPEPLTPDQWARIHEYEEHIARVLEQRRGSRPRRPWWKLSPWVGSITAVVTLVFTALVGYVSQASLKGIELELSLRSAHAAAMRTAMIDAYALAGSMLKINEERVLLAQGKLDALPSAERDSIARNTNRIQQQWRSERERAAILLFLYPGPNVEALWRVLREAVEDHTTCVEGAFIAYQRTRAPDTICAATHSRTLRAVEDFRAALRERFLEIERSK